MILFLDPEPLPVPIGALVLDRCDECGGAAAVRDYYVGPVRCAACWSAHFGTDPMRPIVPARHLRVRYAGGERPAPAAANRPHALGGQTARGAGRKPSPYRVLIAAQPATPSQLPAGASAVLVAATSADLAPVCTYALAEEGATGRMVHSVAVRVPGHGFGVWWNGAFTSAMWRDISRVHGQGHLLALAGGTPWTVPAAREPAPRGPCPRCGSGVRWRIEKSGAPVTWKHNRALTGEGERATKVTCE